MNKHELWVVMAMVLAQSSAFAADADADAKAESEEQEVAAQLPADRAASATPRALSRDTAAFCFFAGGPPSDAKYQLVRKMKIGKGSYGSVTDLLPRLAEASMLRGADAMINYTGSQRFGFFPWRVVRPVVRGDAIRWTEPPSKDCAAMGGSTLQTILETDRPPG